MRVRSRDNSKTLRQLAKVRTGQNEISGTECNIKIPPK